ncbi:MAG: hypothetical protein ACI8Y4_003214 [Candidatus Poriferisodalaceae bacterium]|jgi:uncharacterized protein (TIGR03086 family)
MSENLRNFTRAVYAMDAVVRRVPDDAWDNASPCEGWTARDVVAHQSGVLVGLASIARTGERVFPQMPEDTSAPLDLWQASRDSALESLDQPGALHHEGGYWFGPMSVDELISVVQWDPVTHAWDLAQAAGIDHHVPDDLVELSMGRIGAMRDALAGMKLIGDEVEVPADAPVMDRFLGLVGRNPSV